MGRLRQPGTCTVFTSVSALSAIEKGDNAHASEMASVLLRNRTSRLLKSALSELLDHNSTPEAASPTTAPAVPAVPVRAPACPSFRFDVFVRYCQSLHMRIAEFARTDACSYCAIVGKVTDHANSNCPVAKGLCNKCYYPGHNRYQFTCTMRFCDSEVYDQSCRLSRNYCNGEAWKVPAGFCIMCLMPVHEVYELHSGRYGMECKNELKDCIKPLLITLYYSRCHILIEQLAAMLWPSGRPVSFRAYWTFLWSHDGDHVYGILKVLAAFMNVICAR
jgi:hypothetical protein